MVSHSSATCNVRDVRAESAGLPRVLRVVEHATRGVAPWVITTAVFAGGGALADAVGTRAGLGLVGAWVLFLGGYCLANFWDCRESHCAVTGPGWTALGLLDLAAAAGVPAGSWLSITATSIAFVVALALGYALEWSVAARTGRHRLGRVGQD